MNPYKMGNSYFKRNKYTNIPDTDKSTVKNLWKEARDKNTCVMRRVFDIQMKIGICGRTFNCLFDTGAQLNAIPKSIIDQLNLDHFVDKEMSLSFNGMSGSGISYGIIPYLDINIHENNCPTGFVVIDRPGINNILLGTSFMRFYKVVLDFEKCKVFMGGSEIPVKIIEGRYFWI